MSSFTDGGEPPPTSLDAMEASDLYPHPLKIAIVGAGIGGLSAAVGLRRAGHGVDLYEQSRFANEGGAAVHLAPNAGGILRRWGIYAEEFGANDMSRLKEFYFGGGLMKEVDLAVANKRWQHPWQLVHRAALHDKLKKVATSTDGPGPPARLHTSSRVIDVDAEMGTIELEDGTLAEADVIVGADGIYSKVRRHVNGGKQPQLLRSGKAAFRFLLPKKLAMEDAVTAPLVQTPNTLGMWYGHDRRVVIYPCNSNETLNFVLIHPDNESHATPSDEWNKIASIDQCLKVFQNFDPALKKLISKADPPELKVWQLLDMKPLPAWTLEKLALLGDAAHPFTPHQGQGAGQAIEDAASLSTVLPLGTSPEEVPERLNLYEHIRRERAHTVQEYSRLAGKDWVDGKPPLDMMQYTNYNFGHDECDNSANIFRRWRWSRNHILRAPIPFGPFPSLPQEIPSMAQPDDPEQRVSAVSVTFKSSRTFLETLFPTNSFRFKDASTVCLATFSLVDRTNVSWLGGRECKSLALYIHDVEYRAENGSTASGSYLPFMFESLPDGPGGSTNRGEAGLPKLRDCDLQIVKDMPSAISMSASYMGRHFAEIRVSQLQPDNNDVTQTESADEAILTYICDSAPNDRHDLGEDYACIQPLENTASVPISTTSVARSKTAKIEFTPGDQKSLPAVHRVVEFLGGIPIYEVVRCQVVEGRGVPGLGPCRRIE